ncbi:acyl-CoA-binding protein (ACBP)/diazepam binding inhibitor (DBI)/endozepine (EP) [Fusarium chlamydosporum]
MSTPFDKAVEDSKKLTSKPGPTELLELYAQGKAKYNAWKKAVEEDQLTPEEAKSKYVELVEKLKEQYGYDANKVPETVE